VRSEVKWGRVADPLCFTVSDSPACVSASNIGSRVWWRKEL